MTHSSPLPHLLRLLDDDSPVVQEAVWAELTARGSELETEVVALGLDDEAETLADLRNRDMLRRRRLLLGHWGSWQEIRDEKTQLERALSLVSIYLTPYGATGALSKMLDDLAAEFRAREETADCATLAHFLFDTMEISGDMGMNPTPEAHSLAAVIDQRRGNSVALTCLFMLVGYRLGVDVQGCDYPGHFLARAMVGRDAILVDCFNGGKVYPAHEFLDLSPSVDTKRVHSVLYRPEPVHDIVSAVLRGLAQAFDAQGNRDDGRVVRKLIRIQQRTAKRNGLIS